MSVDGFSVTNQSRKPVPTNTSGEFLYQLFLPLKVIQGGVDCTWLVLLWLFFLAYSFAEIGDASV